MANRVESSTVEAL